MLSYAFKELRGNDYKNVATEEFKNFADICAAILAKGVSLLLKRGLMREFITQTEPLSSPRGRFDLTESIKTRSLLRKQLVCSYDEFSVNAYMNRIIKTTMEFLVRANIKESRKTELKKLLMYFEDIDTLDIHTINWRRQYDRSNRAYKMPVSICYLAVKGLLQTQTDGTVKLMDFLDKQKMHALFQSFIFEYYKQEYEAFDVASPIIYWNIGDFDDSYLLPLMKTDIVLSHEKKTLVIDAKYYSRITQKQFNKHSIRSAHIYQIFAYVKNFEANNANKTVSGMLLYAGTDEEIQPDVSYEMSGNRISVKTLDLNCDFENIKKQLDLIADSFIKGEI